jgi:ferredoxin-type protein NapF
MAMRLARRQFLSGRFSPGAIGMREPHEQSPLKAAMLQSCLARRGVMCRTCGDACAERAIRFVLERGGVAAPHVAFASCTGCGACVHVCPANAVALYVPAATAAI